MGSNSLLTSVQVYDARLDLATKRLERNFPRAKASYSSHHPLGISSCRKTDFPGRIELQSVSLIGNLAAARTYNGRLLLVIACNLSSTSFDVANSSIWLA